MAIRGVQGHVRAVEKARAAADAGVLHDPGALRIANSNANEMGFGRQLRNLNG